MLGSASSEPNRREAPRVIMFDLDGTLVDTMGAFADLAAEVMERFHAADRVKARAAYMETSGFPFVRQLEIIYPGHGANSAASDDFETRKRAICDRVSMTEATVRALERLRARGIGLVVSSNTGQSFVDDFVRRERFAFDLALGFDAASGLEKGRPHVERALAHFAVGRAQLWFVGDSLNDGRLARECQVRFVGRVGTFSADAFQQHFPEAAVIREIDELNALV